MPKDGVNAGAAPAFPNNNGTGTAIVNDTSTVPTIVWTSWNTVFTSCQQVQFIPPVTTSGTSDWSQWNIQIYNNTYSGITVQWGAWGAWNSNFVAGSITNGQIRPGTPEEIARARAAQEAACAAQAVEAEKQAVANEKAKKLLVEHLSAEQQKTYEEKRYFDVDIEGRTYRIHHGSHGNVRLLGTGDKAGKEITKYCIQPEGVPIGDVLLAQKLLLEANEKEFLRIANATRLIA
jgi:hypothetical protein